MNTRPIVMGCDRNPGGWLMAREDGLVLTYDRTADLHGVVKAAIDAQASYVVADSRPDASASAELVGALRAVGINSWRAMFVRDVDVFQVGNDIVRINRAAAAMRAFVREEDDAAIYAWVARCIAGAGGVHVLSTRSLAHTVADTLNRLRKADPAVADALVHTRRQCSKAVADDPSIIVGVTGEGENERYSLGLLGLLNGIILDAGCAKRLALVTATDDPDNMVIEFRAVDWPPTQTSAPADPPAALVV